MSIRSRLPLVCLSAFVCLLACAPLARAQHEPASGGGTIGGGSTSTGRPANKPVNRPANKPTSTPVTTPPRRRPTSTTTTTGRKPTGTTTTGPTADSYYQQGEALYNAKQYKDALEKYLNAVDVNPSMASALYRIGWIYNDLEEYDSAV